MTKRNNRFGIEPISPTDVTLRRSREPGPMGVAVRETAEVLQNSTEAMVEQRRQNAADARAYRVARDEGRVLIHLGLDEVHIDDLPRDRIDLDAVAASDEMEELKSSIRARGQKEPIEVYRDAGGRIQLKKGWRRLTALRQLWRETGDDRFARVVARDGGAAEERVDLYIDMVEENLIREDLTFAEMAQIAIDAAGDATTGLSDVEAAVGRLYASLHKMKRSYIRSFTVLLQVLGDDLPYPKAVSRNLGVEVARRLKEDGADVDGLRTLLAGVGTAEQQNAALAVFAGGERVERVPQSAAPKEKFEFRCGAAKVTARAGECRIKAKIDFPSLDRAVLERAVQAFNAVIEKG